MQIPLRKAGKVPHVAIIGAGFSGLRAADVLIRSGVKVTIYEARNRLGGRVHQVALIGRPMDMGANWIHGTEGNPIKTLAEKTKTILHSLDGSMTVFDTKGEVLPDKVAKEAFEATWGIIEKAFEYSDKNKDTIDPSRSLFNFFEEMVPTVTSDPQKQSMILEICNEWGSFVGDSIKGQSLKFFFLESTIDGEVAFVAGSYEKILAEVSRTAKEKAEIRYNEEVTKIESAYPSKMTAEKDSFVTIQTPSSEATYDEVIVTCPLGYLQQHKSSLFAEPLPPRLSEAIDNINYGRLEKVYISFPSPWWRRNGQSTVTDVSDAHANASNETSSSTKSPQFVHFLSPEYVSHPSDVPWNQETIDMSHFSSTASQPTLLFYIYGPCGTSLVKSLRDITPHSPGYDQILTQFFTPYYSRLPTYNEKDPECKPSGFLATQWQNDPLAGNGSYTNFQVPATKLDEDIITIREATGTGIERGIWFAGEHTSPFIALGTTTGAYWSGEGIAKRLCELWGLSIPEGVVEDGEGVEDGRRMDEEKAKPFGGGQGN